MDLAAPRGWPAMLLAAVCLVGLGIAWGLGYIGGGVTYQGYEGTAVVSADGRTLTVVPSRLSCTDHATVVARESVSRVGLFYRHWTPIIHGTCPPGYGSLGGAPPQEVRLHAPLGHRRLVNGATGAATPWVSARMLLKLQLPKGYRLIEPVQVRGQTGRAAPGIIAWREGELYDYLSAYTTGHQGQRALTTQELIAIADKATFY